MSHAAFQFAILRYYHDPVTQEFLNIGVVLYSKERRYLKAIINKRYGRVSRTFNGIERNHYTRMVSAIDNQIGRLASQLLKPTLFDEYPDALEMLLGNVLPTDDSSLRFGGFGGGVVADFDSELDRLFYRLVEKYEGRDDEPETRRDEQVWHDYATLFSEYQIVEHLQPKTLGTSHYAYTFTHAYKNDRWHPVEAISFDLSDASYILEKANKWIGRTVMLGDSEEVGTLYFLLGAPRKRPELLEAYENAALNLETKIRIPVKVIKEEDSADFAREFSALIQSHQKLPTP